MMDPFIQFYIASAIVLIVFEIYVLVLMLNDIRDKKRS